MKFTFKPFKGDKSSSPDVPDPNQTPQQKRREQVRRAQRSHRDRKEAYTKQLEAEVVQLRANETRLFQETQSLYAEISVLKELLVRNGIPIPERPVVQQGLESGPDMGPSSSTLTLNVPAKRDKRQRRIHIQNSAEQARSPHSASEGLSSSSLTSPSNLSSPPQSLPPSSGHAIAGPSAIAERSRLCVRDADPTTIGMDFVLTLESPCFGHVDVDHSEHAPATGHALMVSATLLHQYSATGSAHSDSARTWQVSEAGIDRLLELSRNIPLDGEITPVQAWDYIRKHDKFADLELERLQVLKDKLVTHIKCHGFGGVIDQAIFENTVFEAFVVGRVF